ncbi:MAG: hypothetical protein HQK77_19910 [Desulfobacterales bacterium]|nr:hypothetical protein [Desulfobacterales bacterium]
METNINIKHYTKLDGKTFAFFGEFNYFPDYHIRRSPERLVEALGGKILSEVSPSLNYLIIGEKRGKGRSDAIRDAKKLNDKHQATIQVLTEKEFLNLVCPKIEKCVFAFIGTFSKGIEGIDGGAAALLSPYHVQLIDTVAPHLDYLIIGDRRGKGKTTYIRDAEEYNSKGAQISILTETQFFDLLSHQKNPTHVTKLDLPSLIMQLRNVLDPKRIERALQMLQKESYHLYTDIKDDFVGGIVKSQTNPDLQYSCFMSEHGEYTCYDNDLNQCMGLQGKVCKHIIVLLLGMSQSGGMKPENAYHWAKNCYRKKPKNNDHISSEMLLRYKSAQLGEIDWRPIETIPEDYYAT